MNLLALPCLCVCLFVCLSVCPSVNLLSFFYLSVNETFVIGSLSVFRPSNYFHVLFNCSYTKYILMFSVFFSVACETYRQLGITLTILCLPVRPFFSVLQSVFFLVCLSLIFFCSDSLPTSLSACLCLLIFFVRPCM